jgi:hypothetical protein
MIPLLHSFLSLAHRMSVEVAPVLTTFRLMVYIKPLNTHPDGLYVDLSAQTDAGTILLPQDVATGLALGGVGLREPMGASTMTLKKCDLFWPDGGQTLWSKGCFTSSGSSYAPCYMCKLHRPSCRTATWKASWLKRNFAQVIASLSSPITLDQAFDCLEAKCSPTSRSGLHLNLKPTVHA